MIPRGKTFLKGKLKFVIMDKSLMGDFCKIEYGLQLRWGWKTMFVPGEADLVGKQGLGCGNVLGGREVKPLHLYV